MSGQHTQGAWGVNWDKGHIYIETTDGDVICDLGKALNGSAQANNEKNANARLIACVPELLAALIQANEKSKLYDQHPGHWAHIIAKATASTADAGVAG